MPKLLRRGALRESLLHERLAGCAGPVSRETFERLVAFEADLPEMEPQHQSGGAVDAGRCLGRAISWTARSWRESRPTAMRWVDLGSGGGFPGLVLAFLLPSATARSDRSGREQPQESVVPADGDRRSSACRRGSSRGASKTAMRLFQHRKSSRRGLWRRCRLCSTCAAPWLTTGARGAVPQRPGLPSRSARKRSPLDVRSGRTSEHDRSRMASSSKCSNLRRRLIRCLATTE